MGAKSLSRVQLSATPWTVAHQAPLSWDSPSKKTDVGFHTLLQKIFPTRVELTFPALADH